MGRLANEVLRLGVLRPSTDWLPAGLRLHASLLRRCGREETACSPWLPAAALESALAPGTLEGSSGMHLAARTLLAQLLPLYREAGWQGAAGSLLRRLTCRQEALAPLRQLPDLMAAVGEWLDRHYAKRGDGEAAGEAGGGEAGAAVEDPEEDEGATGTDEAGSPRGYWPGLGGRGSGQPFGRGRGRGGRGSLLHGSRCLARAPSNALTRAYRDSSREMLRWWLSDPDETAALQRAQASVQVLSTVARCQSRGVKVARPTTIQG